MTDDTMERYWHDECILARKCAEVAQKNFNKLLLALGTVFIISKTEADVHRGIDEMVKLIKELGE